MSSLHGITAENLLQSLPIALQQDETVRALAASAAKVLASRPKEIDRLLIYPNIDALDEELLDILAYDFKVDWWDGDYSISEKRRTLQDSWRVHRMLGTKAAVETAISAIYPDAKAEEWFEYDGGRPYHFRLRIRLAMDDNDIAKRKRVLDRVNYYKNLRSHCDGVEYSSTFPEMSDELYITPCRYETRMISVLPELRPVTEHRCAVYVTPYLGSGMAVTRLPPLEPERGALPGRLCVDAAATTISETRLPVLERPDNENEEEIL